MKSRLVGFYCKIGVMSGSPVLGTVTELRKVGEKLFYMVSTRRGEQYAINLQCIEWIDVIREDTIYSTPTKADIRH